MCYSVQPRDQKFVKSFGFLPRNIEKNIGKNISKNINSKYNKKLRDQLLNNLLHMHLKPLQKEQFKKQKQQLVICWEIKWLKIARFSSKASLQNNSVANEEEILRERYISPEKQREHY